MNKKQVFISLIGMAAVMLSGCGVNQTGTATGELADGVEQTGFNEGTKANQGTRTGLGQRWGTQGRQATRSRVGEDVPNLIAAVIRAFATGTTRGGEGSVSGLPGVDLTASVIDGVSRNNGWRTAGVGRASTGGNGNGNGQVGNGRSSGRTSGGAGLNVPLFDQNNVGAAKPSAYCGPTSVKMVLDYFGVKKNVNDCAKGVYVSGAGASHGGMLTKLQKEGLAGSYLTYGKSLSWLKGQTDAGKPVIVNVKGDYGPRSTNGHVVVVTGVTNDGKVIINDPAGGRKHAVDGGTFNSAWHRASGSGLGIVCAV